jgi:hypothetical protein
VLGVQGSVSLVVWSLCGADRREMLLYLGISNRLLGCQIWVMATSWCIAYERCSGVSTNTVG